MMVQPSARPIGDGGVSTISSAAGRNSVSTRSRPPCFGRKPSSDMTMRQPDVIWPASQPNKPRRGGGSMRSTDFMETRLEAVQGGVMPAAAEEVLVASVLDDVALADR